MKNLVGKVTVVMFIASNVFAVGAKDVRSKDDTRKDSVVGGATASAGQTRQTYLTSLLNRVENAGILGNVKKSTLSEILMRDDVKMDYTKNSEKNGKSAESLTLIEVLNDLSSRSNSMKPFQLELAKNLVEAMSNERASSKDKNLNKLLAEGRKMLDPGSTSTEREISSYSSKLKLMNDSVAEGKSKSLDEAYTKVLTESERKKVEDCISA
jgi:hypothetical protein